MIRTDIREQQRDRHFRIWRLLPQDAHEPDQLVELSSVQRCQHFPIGTTIRSRTPKQSLRRTSGLGFFQFRL